MKRERTNNGSYPCPLGIVVDLIGKKWTLPIISIIGNRHKARFSEIMQEIDTISPKTLSARLKDLIHEGIVQRDVLPEMPLRVEYSLTEEGEQLRKAVIPLFRWASERQLKELS